MEGGSASFQSAPPHSSGVCSGQQEASLSSLHRGGEGRGSAWRCPCSSLSRSELGMAPSPLGVENDSCATSSTWHGQLLHLCHSPQFLASPPPPLSGGAPCPRSGQPPCADGGPAWPSRASFQPPTMQAGLSGFFLNRGGLGVASHKCKGRSGRFPFAGQTAVGLATSAASPACSDFPSRPPGQLPGQEERRARSGGCSLKSGQEDCQAANAGEREEGFLSLGSEVPLGPSAAIVLQSDTASLL